MAYPSVYPTSLDSYTTKTDNVDNVMAVDVNELQSAITAIETLLGIGGVITINKNTASPPAPPAGNLLQLIAADGVVSRVYLNAFASSAQICGCRANTTNAAPSALAATDLIAAFGAFGYGATGYSAAARGRVDIRAAEAWTDTAQGTFIAFYNSLIGAASATEKARISDDGKLGIGTTVPKSALHVVGLATYANNAAAVAAGLTAGAFYRNNADPDLVCVVH